MQEMNGSDQWFYEEKGERLGRAGIPVSTRQASETKSGLLHRVDRQFRSHLACLSHLIQPFTIIKLSIRTHHEFA